LKTIGSNAFSYCEQLNKLGAIAKSVSYIGDGVFIHCDKLANIEVEDGNEFFESDGDVLFSKGKTKLIWYSMVKEDESYTIPNSVKEIGAYAFFDNKNLIDILLPNNLTRIGDNGFSECFQIERIIIPGTVTSIGNGAFYDCPALKTVIYLGEYDPGIKSKDIFGYEMSLSQICVGPNYKSSKFCGEDNLYPLNKCGINFTTKYETL